MEESELVCLEVNCVARHKAPYPCVHNPCCGLRICVPPNPYVGALVPSVMFEAGPLGGDQV